jgi:hypothetical protein
MSDSEAAKPVEDLHINGRPVGKDTTYETDALVGISRGMDRFSDGGTSTSNERLG